jgi:hypothetical protein
VPEFRETQDEKISVAVKKAKMIGLIKQVFSAMTMNKIISLIYTQKKLSLSFILSFVHQIRN